MVRTRTRSARSARERLLARDRAKPVVRDRASAIIIAIVARLVARLHCWEGGP